MLLFRKQLQVFIIGEGRPHRKINTISHTQVSLTDIQGPSANEGLEPDLPQNQSQFVTEFRGGRFRPILSKRET